MKILLAIAFIIMTIWLCSCAEKPKEKPKEKPETITSGGHLYDRPETGDAKDLVDDFHRFSDGEL